MAVGRFLEEDCAIQSKEAWDRFETDLKALRERLGTHTRGSVDAQASADLREALGRLRDAADGVFDSLGTASRDPEVRATTKEAARSFGIALAESFREIGEDLAEALRRPAQRK